MHHSSRGSNCGSFLLPKMAERKAKMSRHIARSRVFVIPLACLVIAIVVGSAFFLTGSPGNIAAATTLGSAAAASGRIFGTSVQASLLSSNTQYTNLLSTQFSGVTPENEMKWDTTEPSQGSFNFSSADQIVSFAQSHSMKIRGH